ncbi:SdpI family protein [Microbacterium sp. JZ31]|uniref:SdpI family protein n=1 Tax=Microbacterium sp. JZ31 TaxID=1906274 RepID=UPI0019328CDF|nr:SdpI family protein [Microbacterium sp. JZ31]
MQQELVARVVLLVAMWGCGALMLWMARAAADGRLQRNHVAGIRLPVTMSSDAAWLAAHRAAKRLTEIAGWCAIASAVPALLPVPLPVVIISVLVGAIAMLAFALRGAAVGARAARANDER